MFGELGIALRKPAPKRDCRNLTGKHALYRAQILCRRRIADTVPDTLCDAANPERLMGHFQGKPCNRKPLMANRRHYSVVQESHP